MLSLYLSNSCQSEWSRRQKAIKAQTYVASEATYKQGYLHFSLPVTICTLLDLLLSFCNNLPTRYRFSRDSNNVPS